VKKFLVKLILSVLFSVSVNGMDNPLPPGEGREETFVYCVSCHSTKIIEQQGLTKDGWVETLEWMVEEQGMPKLDQKVHSKIIKYLVSNFSPERPFFSPP